MAQHVNKTHKVSSEEYYTKYIGHTTSECSVCGGTTKFVNISEGYKEYCSYKCSGVGNREKLRNDPDKYKKFVEKVSDNMINLWSDTDTTERVEKMTRSVNKTISEMSVEEKSDRFGWMNKLHGDDRKDAIDRVLDASLRKFYRNITDDEKMLLIERVRKTKLGDRYDMDVMGEFILYRSSVRYLTEKTYKKHMQDINPKGLKRKRGKGGWQLDHRYSIVQGFIDSIEPEIISSTHNLQMLTSQENSTKNHRCDITKENLLNIYYDR